MKIDYNGKKILVLGGAYQHTKIVETAKQLGIKTYVTDYLKLEDSPAKQVADVKLYFNIFDIDKIVEYCKKEKINGVIGPYLDPVQKPYYEICEKLGLPYFGDKKSYDILTDKVLFKDFCIQNGGGIIKSYNIDQIKNDDKTVDYPLFIKPADSRGSRGQYICKNKQEVLNNISKSLKESSSGNVIIEKYIENIPDVQLMYLIIDYEPVLVRLEDRYLGDKEENLNNLCTATVVPSKISDHFEKNINPKIIAFLKKLNIKYAPIFLQAFITEDDALLYDPGLRFSGDDYDRLYTEITGIDLSKMFIDFSLTGKIDHELLNEIKINKVTSPTGMLLPCLKKGKIKEISGINQINNIPNVVTASYFYGVGDEIEKTGNVKQRLCEIVLKANDLEELKENINNIFGTLKVVDENDNDMLICKFDVSNLNEYKKLYRKMDY